MRSDFLPNAKSQLDADHFGLDKVKTVREVLDAAFGPGSLPWHAPDAHPIVESSL
jgi:hypothetical protein